MILWNKTKHRYYRLIDLYRLMLSSVLVFGVSKFKRLPWLPSKTFLYVLKKNAYQNKKQFDKEISPSSYKINKSLSSFASTEVHIV